MIFSITHDCPSLESFQKENVVYAISEITIKCHIDSFYIVLLVNCEYSQEDDCIELKECKVIENTLPELILIDEFDKNRKQFITALDFDKSILYPWKYAIFNKILFTMGFGK